MQVVIEIPEEYRELFVKDKFEEKFNSLCTNEFGYVFRKAFENGIVLPKGHSRLISSPTMEEIEKTIGGKNEFADCIREAVKAVFDNAKTIIQANKENTE